nr:aspartate/glutamate racemase family protein [uncultured Lichenicoccus sp.]
MNLSPRIAILNPNTTLAFTERLAAAGRGLAASGTTVVARSPARGTPSVECHVDEAIATLGLIGLASEEEALGTDAYVIACFGDTGLEAVRETVTGPVVGMTEAALHAAMIVAPFFSIVTLPPRTIVHAERVVHSHGLGHRCRRVRAIDVDVDDCVDLDPELLAMMIAESRRALDEDGAEAIILGCAGLSALVAPMRECLGVPVVEGVGVALKIAEALVANGLATSKRSSYATPPRCPEDLP